METAVEVMEYKISIQTLFTSVQAAEKEVGELASKEVRVNDMDAY